MLPHNPSTLSCALSPSLSHVTTEPFPPPPVYSIDRPSSCLTLPSTISSPFLANLQKNGRGERVDEHLKRRIQNKNRLKCYEKEKEEKWMRRGREEQQQQRVNRAQPHAPSLPHPAFPQNLFLTHVAFTLTLPPSPSSTLRLVLVGAVPVVAVYQDVISSCVIIVVLLSLIIAIPVLCPLFSFISSL